MVTDDVPDDPPVDAVPLNDESIALLTEPLIFEPDVLDTTVDPLRLHRGQLLAIVAAGAASSRHTAPRVAGRGIGQPADDRECRSRIGRDRIGPGTLDRGVRNQHGTAVVFWRPYAGERTEPRSTTP